MKLTDTQLVILSAAANRENRFVLPLPKSLKGGAATKVITALINKGLVEEVAAKLADPRWKEDNEGRATTLVVTDSGLAALDGDSAATRPEKVRGRQKAGKAKKGPREPRQEQGKAKAKAGKGSRAGSKQAQLIAMLKRPTGASIEEIVNALAWQPHTVRGAIAGALKKKLGLAVTPEKLEGRHRVYRIKN